MNELNAELDDILRRSELTLQIIAELTEEIALREAGKENVERCLEEGNRIAATIEARGQVRVQAILDETESVVVAQKTKMALVEEEIAVLHRELNPGYFVIQGSAPNISEIENSSATKAEAGEDKLINPTMGVRHRKNQPEMTDIDEARYTMQIVAFVNARHFVTFGGEVGPIHDHSWQAQIEIEVPTDKNEIVGFAQISSAITSTLLPYENTVLNLVYPFNQIQPTTENMAMYFYNCLEDALVDIGLGLSKMTLWEKPTRGIKVSTRNSDFENIIPIDKGTQDIKHSLFQTTAIQENESRGELTSASDRKNHFPAKPIWLYLVGAVIILLVAFLVYHKILLAPFEQRYPWGI